MDPTDQQLTEKLSAFDSAQEPTSLYEALDLLEAAQRGAPTGDLAARKRMVSRWLDFFVVLDRNMDPAWDPSHVPAKGVAPPVLHGVVYPSGEVDPSSIPDPAVRAEYTRALKANKDENRKFGVQLQLRRIDERAMRVVERFLADRYTSYAADVHELDELLAGQRVSAPRTQRLRAMMPRAAAP